MNKNRILIAVFVLSFAVFPMFGYAQEFIAPDELRRMQMKDIHVVLIDVRGASQFKAKHIKDAVNIPYAAIKNVALPTEAVLVLYCSGTGCSISARAAKILLGKGYKNVYILDSGIAGWEETGYSLIMGSKSKSEKSKMAPLKITRISSKELLSALDEGKFLILDVRPSLEFKAGHLPGARNLPLEELSKQLEEIQQGKILVVYDRLSNRTRKAVQQLMDAGFDVLELSGGLTVWAAHDYPLEVGTVLLDN